MARKRDHDQQPIIFPRKHIPLYQERGDRPLMDLLRKAYSGPEAAKAGASSQDHDSGAKIPPLDFDSLVEFKNHNPYHSTCIDTKANSLVGLGFVTEQERKDRQAAKQMAQQGPAPAGQMGIQPPQEAKGVNKEDLARVEERRSKAEEVLDPLCEVSIQAVLGPVAEDFEQTGNGYIEVVRDTRTMEITGLHHVPASSVLVVIEDESYNGHFQIVDADTVSGSYKKFARFGDSENLMKRFPEDKPKDRVSEIIHFKEPSSQSRWYGMPKWLSAVAGIELFQCIHQHEYDFFLNRGVPEFMLFLLGSRLSEDDWDALESAMEANIGLGNSSKSVALNLQDPEMKVQLEKLGLGQDFAEGFKDRVDTLSLEIVTAHRVPPLLAGIQIPGKLGAANEIVSAMKAFQTLVIGPKQKIFETTLGNTLGNSTKNGGLGLGQGDFELRKITDEMEVEQLDTVSRMRQDFNAPENKGRDPKDGLKD